MRERPVLADRKPVEGGMRMILLDLRGLQAAAAERAGRADEIRRSADVRQDER